MKTSRTIQNGAGSYLFITSDEHVFFEKETAQSHANTLQDKTVRTLTRQEAERQAAGLDEETPDGDELEAFLDELTGN